MIDFGLDADTVLAALPDIVRAAAEPMEHIDSLTIMSTDGASEMVKNTTRVVAESATAIKGLTGLDVPNLIGSAMRSGGLAGLRRGEDGERGGNAKPSPTPTAGSTATTPPAAAAAPTTATNGQSTTTPPTMQSATAAAAAATAAAVTTAKTGLEAAEDDAARLLAKKFREIPNVSDYAHLRVSEVGRTGPRPMRILWRIAETQVGKRYGAMTVGELMSRFGAQAQH